jgi:hypothetical protein
VMILVKLKEEGCVSLICGHSPKCQSAQCYQSGKTLSNGSIVSSHLMLVHLAYFPLLEVPYVHCHD